jgi:endoglucanase
LSSISKCPQKSATWGTGNLTTDWNTAAEKAGKAVLAINPDVLIIVEGTQVLPR